MDFNAQSINKLRLNTSAFNLRVIGKDDISNIKCSLKNIDKSWVTFYVAGETLVLSVTEKGSTIKTIWNTNSKRTIKIFVPKNKLFSVVSVVAGVGLTRLKNITCEKLKFASGIGVAEILQVNVEKRTKISGGVGRVRIKNSTLKNLSLKGGIGLIQFTGKLLGKTNIAGGIGKIALKVNDIKSNFNIKTKSSFFDNLYIDGILAKNYTNQNESENSFFISGGLGVIDLRFSS